MQPPLIEEIQEGEDSPGKELLLDDLTSQEKVVDEKQRRKVILPLQTRLEEVTPVQRRLEDLNKSSFLTHSNKSYSMERDWREESFGAGL